MCNYCVTIRHKFLDFDKKKRPKEIQHSLGLLYSLTVLNYLFENCGARRAALRPYFLRSLARGSRVTNPAAFNTGR